MDLRNLRKKIKIKYNNIKQIGEFAFPGLLNSLLPAHMSIAKNDSSLTLFSNHMEGSLSVVNGHMKRLGSLSFSNVRPWTDVFM